MEPIEAMADQALASGSVDSLTNKVAAHVKKGITERSAKVIEAKKSADKSVEAGREYVEAYITYLHYVIGIHSAVMAKGGHSQGAVHGESKHAE